MTKHTFDPSEKGEPRAPPENGGFSGALVTTMPKQSHIRASINHLKSVGRRYKELDGSQLAASLAFSGFVSIFPVLFIAIAVMGRIAANDDSFTQRFIEQLGLSGSTADLFNDAIEVAKSSRQAVGAIGAVSLILSATNLGGAISGVMSAVWQGQIAGWKTKLKALAWLLLAAPLFAVAAAAPAAGSRIDIWQLSALIDLAIPIAVDFALFMSVAMLLPARLPMRALIPGAILGSIGFTILNAAGATYLPKAVSGSSALYGSIGVILALLAWVYLYARLFVYANIANVVVWEDNQGVSTKAISIPAGLSRPSTEVYRNGRVGPVQKTSK